VGTAGIANTGGSIDGIATGFRSAIGSLMWRGMEETFGRAIPKYSAVTPTAMMAIQRSRVFMCAGVVDKMCLTHPSASAITTPAIVRASQTSHRACHSFSKGDSRKFKTNDVRETGGGARSVVGSPDRQKRRLDEMRQQPRHDRLHREFCFRGVKGKSFDPHEFLPRRLAAQNRHGAPRKPESPGEEFAQCSVCAPFNRWRIDSHFQHFTHPAGQFVATGIRNGFDGEAARSCRGRVISSRIMRRQSKRFGWLST